MFETIEIGQRPGIATQWMNRPDVLHAFKAQIIEDLSAFIDKRAAAWLPQH